MNIKGKNKAKILAALYNNAKTQGMGFLYYEKEDMTEEQAIEILDSGETHFYYLKGRVMMVDLSGDELEAALYDRDNGHGSCEGIVNAID